MNLPSGNVSRTRVVGRRLPYVSGAVTLVVFAILFATVDAGSVLDAFSGVIWFWVALRLLQFIVGLSIQSLRWKILLRDQGVSTRAGLLFKRCWIARFYTNVLPGQVAGDAYRVANNSGIPASRTLMASTVFMDRMVGLLGLLLLVSVTGLVKFQVASDVGLAALPLLSVVGLFLLLPWLVMRQPSERLLAWVGKLPGNKLTSTAGAMLQVLSEQTTRKRTLAITLALSITFHTSMVMSSYFAFRALDVEVGFLTVVLIAPLVNFAALAPFSINGLGVREGVFTILFVAVGVPASDAVAVALLSRTTTVGMALLGGVWGLADSRGMWQRLAGSLRRQALPPDPSKVAGVERRRTSLPDSSGATPTPTHGRS